MKTFICPIRKASALAVAGLFVSVANATAATTAATPVDNILVTATRTSQTLAETMAQAVIISRDDIEAAGMVSLAELLQRRAGVAIRATGGPGQPASVFMRGANGAHTLVLIDGMRVGSSTSGATALENIAPDMIERIEIVKGPRSGLYGSDAIGGVIQIFTRRAKASGAYVGFGAGTFAAQHMAGGLTLVGGDTTFTLVAGRQKINAPSATNDSAGSFTFNADGDPYQNTNGKIGVAHRINATDEVRLDVWQSQGKTAFDSGAGNAETVNKQTLFGASLQFHNQLSAHWRSRLVIGQTVDDITIIAAFGGKFKTRQNQYTWQHDASFGGLDGTAGFERRDENVSATTGYTRRVRSTDALFLAGSKKMDAWSLSANLRHDREQQFGARNTGGVTAGVQLSTSQFLYASAATAFRAPSFNDLYFPGFSNAALQPEKSRSSEIGWRLTQPGVRVNAAIFDNQIENLIAFDFVTSKPQNVQRARIRGMETAVDATLAGIDWRLQLTTQNPKDEATGKQLRSRARLFGALGAGQTLGAWRWRVDAVVNGARFDSANEAPASRMGGYTLLNAQLAYAINRRWQLDVTGNNLGDRVYALARGYNPLGRQVMLGVKFTME